MRWLVLPTALVALAGLAYGLWPREPEAAAGGLDAAAVAAALADLGLAEPDAGSRASAAAPGKGTPLSFPQDHGAHPDAPMELWELNALLRHADQQPIAVRLSMARLRLTADPAAGATSRAARHPDSQPRVPRASALAADSVFAGELVMMSEAGVLEAGAVRAQRVSRAALGLAGAGADEAGVERVWIEQWSLSQASDGAWVLRAAADGLELELGLAPMKPPVELDQQALSGGADQPASAPVRFYSQSRLAASGWLRVEGVEHALQGMGWLDHGWGALADALAGGRGQLVANRFLLQLDNGSELVCLHLRRRSGGGTPLPSCVLIGGTGEKRVFGRRELTLVPTDRGWRRSGGVAYPLGWRLEIPALELSLEIEPLFDNEALPGESAAVSVASAVEAWRGAVAVDGWQGSDAIRGSGRMDLNGYAEARRVGT